MAKRKKAVHVEVTMHSVIVVTCDDMKMATKEIGLVEGVGWVDFLDKINFIHVHVDPRYDAQEVAAEIELLLSAEVPDVFRTSEAGNGN